MRHGALLLGPAGSGKSTFCKALQLHALAAKRELVLVNLDPAADALAFAPSVDIRELVDSEEMAQAMGLGPNGALIRSIEHLADNLEWLYDALNEAGPSDDEFFVFDCPGQIELYTHVPAMRRICDGLKSVFGLQLCGVFLVDSMMVDGDPTKYLSAVLLATSAMLQLELPWVNVLSKVDLFKASNSRTKGRSSEKQELVSVDKPVAAKKRDDDDDDESVNSDLQEMLDVDFTHLSQSFQRPAKSPLEVKWRALNQALCGMVEEFSMVRFVALDASDLGSVALVLQHIDFVTQYGEDIEPQQPKEAEEDEEEEEV